VAIIANIGANLRIYRRRADFVHSVLPSLLYVFKKLRSKSLNLSGTTEFRNNKVTYMRSRSIRITLK
jgi:hypothetical protein